MKEDLEEAHGFLAQSLLAAIVQSSDDAIISKDLSGTITSWNAAAEKIFGYTAGEAVGQSILMLIPPGNQEEERLILARIAEGERVEHFRTQRLAKDGRLVDVSITVSPVRDKAGKIVGASKVARDITGQQELTLAKKHLAAIIESSDDAIISKNLTGVITSWNTGAVKIFGYTPEEAIGRNILMLIPQDRQHEEPEILSKLMKKQRIDHFQTKRMAKDGRLLDISVTVSPILDDNGEIIGASKVARDITEQKRAQELLENAKEELERRVAERTEALRTLAIELSRTERRERKRLAQALHDDIQQLLVAVKIHASFIPLTEGSEAAISDVSRLTDLAINACRSLVVGLSPPLIMETDLAGVLRWLARTMLEQHGLEVTVSADNVPKLHEDLRLMIFEIVRELLFNVVKHAGAKKANVNVQEETGQLRIVVVDEGVGCDSATMDDISSSGFGLFSIRERLAGLGGAFSMKTAPGGGCEIVLTMPIGNGRQSEDELPLIQPPA